MYKIQEFNKDEKEFFELVMNVLRLTNADKSEMRDHITAYIQPYTNQKVLNFLKALNPIPREHQLNEEIKQDFKYLDELIKEQKVNTEEDFYSDYEGDGKIWIDKLMAGNTAFYYDSPSRTEAGIEIQNFEKHEFLNFVCIQYFRTDGMRKIIAENIQDMLKLIIDHMDTIEGKRHVNFNPNNVNPEHILPHFIWIMQAKCSAGLTKAELQIVRNKTGLPFITSDQPVINMKAKVGKEAPAEFVLWYPLSPENGVIINGERGEKELDNKINVDTLNRMVWDHSFEYVVGNKEELLEGMADMNW